MQENYNVLSSFCEGKDAQGNAASASVANVARRQRMARRPWCGAKDISCENTLPAMALTCTPPGALNATLPAMSRPDNSLEGCVPTLTLSDGGVSAMCSMFFFSGGAAHPNERMTYFSGPRPALALHFGNFRRPARSSLCIISGMFGGGCFVFPRYFFS